MPFGQSWENAISPRRTVVAIGDAKRMTRVDVGKEGVRTDSVGRKPSVRQECSAEATEPLG
jgi:hypothetical protein